VPASHCDPACESAQPEAGVGPSEDDGAVEYVPGAQFAHCLSAVAVAATEKYWPAGHVSDTLCAQFRAVPLVVDDEELA